MSALPVAVPAGSVNGRPQPVIEAEGGLSLRPFTDADADTLVRAYADPDIERWHRRTLTHDEALEWVRGRAAGRWQAETGAEWAVVDGSGILIGRVGLPVLHLGEGTAEVGYWVLPEGRGRGVAGRALTAMTEWLFALGIHRVELMHSVHNEPSCRVATKNGFELEGVRRSALLHPDGWHDMHAHARITPG